MEFIFMIMAGTFMIIIFMVIFSELYQDNIRDKKRILIEDYAYSLQNEFILASAARQGYVRNFFVINTLEGFNYEVSLSNKILFLNDSENIFLLSIPNVNGTIKKGWNIITNQNGYICINC